MILMTMMMMMVMMMISLLLVVSLVALEEATSGDKKGWCNKTPYPGACKKYLTSTQAIPKDEGDFRKMVIESVMERAVNADVRTKKLESNCRNSKEKAAWADCVKLYKSTITQLNQTLDPKRKCTDFDKQIWLSTALTNLETCRTGFVEFGVNLSDYMLSCRLLSDINNVSQFISNSLALFRNNGSSSGNEAPQSSNNNKVDGFPTWVSPRDRKLLQSDSKTTNIIFVAKDGSGNYSTIKAAVDAAAQLRDRSTGRFVIRIKRGIYQENVEIEDNLKNIMLHGDGLRHTIITGNRNHKEGFTTYDTATVVVEGDRFMAKGITFRNTAGPQNHQAVALRSSSDLSVFYRCGFEGYQDTLYVHSGRQFYKKCYIYGTVDFIFGDATAVLQNCMIYARRPMDKQKNTITAQGRKDGKQPTGIAFQSCRVMPSSELIPVLDSFKTYLGRPWRKYSRTVFLKTYIASFVDPAGWLEWNGDFALDTLYYGEYHNYGPGSSTAKRVSWRGHHVITSRAEASQFSVDNFIKGRHWLPNTNVPFSPHI